MKNAFKFHLKHFHAQDIQVFVFSSFLFSICQTLLESESLWHHQLAKHQEFKNTVWYFERKRRSLIETWLIDRVSNKENFYGKSMQQIWTKS